MAGYSARVGSYFARDPAAPGCDAAGEAGSVAAGTWVQFGVDIADGRLTRVGFRAFACPHIIAACQRLVERLQGESVDALAIWSPEELRHEFEIPVEKAGKLLIVKDALSACHETIGAGNA